jgi:hypothetical protein
LEKAKDCPRNEKNEMTVEAPIHFKVYKKKIKLQMGYEGGEFKLFYESV